MPSCIILKLNQQGHGLPCTYHQKPSKHLAIRPTVIAAGEEITIFNSPETAREYLRTVITKEKDKKKFHILEIGDPA